MISKKCNLTLLLLLSTSFSLNAAENWAGANVGLSISSYDYENKGHGASFDDTSPSALSVWAATNDKKSDNGVGVGIKGGYNWQTDNFVYGVLADLTYIDAKIKSETPGGIHDGFYSYKRVDELNWLATVRGKAGIDLNGFLPYVTAGLAVADVENKHQTITCCPTLYESSDNDTKVGYVIGFGVEKKINENWGVNFDYSYIDLGKDRGNAHGVVGSATANPSRVKLENELTLINLGLNYYF
ncbi:outer membrane protein [Methylotenera sp. G11]|uniref:outer membrane protein n=1 Tax=Methylotenera sp. G11 TaxID=1506585 RepID=UPI000A845FE0|nr:outer membrane beta-barrel protein [Methylotenera sp. G11]